MLLYSVQFLYDLELTASSLTSDKFESAKYANLHKHTNLNCDQKGTRAKIVGHEHDQYVELARMQTYHVLIKQKLECGLACAMHVECTTYQ